MTLSPRAPGIGRRRRWLAAGALAVLLGVAGSRAGAQDDPYSATVPVDATSDNAATGRDLARLDGQRRALAAVVDRLAGGPGKAKPPKLSDSQITDLVTSFEVANEKMSAVRYVADYTFHFRPADVKKALQSAGIAIAEPGTGGPVAAAADAKPIIVLPVYQSGAGAVLWEDPNPWRDAWTDRQAGGGAAKLMVPMGDGGDLGAIDADKARAGDCAALAEIARKYAADEALTVAAVQRAGAGDAPGGIDVTVRRFRRGQAGDVHSDSVERNPGEGDDAFFRRAVAQIAGDIDSGWKNVKEPRVDQLGSIVATLRVSGLDDWIKVRDRVAAVPAVRKIEVRSLSRQEATIELRYVGGLDQLKASLAEIKLGLEGGDPAWRIARSEDKPGEPPAMSGQK